MPRIRTRPFEFPDEILPEDRHDPHIVRNTNHDERVRVAVWRSIQIAALVSTIVATPFAVHVAKKFGDKEAPHVVPDHVDRTNTDMQITVPVPPPVENQPGTNDTNPPR